MHPSSTIAAILLGVTLFMAPSVHGQNTPAQAQCRSIHHMDAEPSSVYENGNCLLKCIIHGRIHLHSLNEGGQCPLATYGICKVGQCVQQDTLGHIDIEVISGEFTRTANAYANVCIVNGSVPMSLPIQHRARCVTCVSNPVYGREPQWNSVCANSNRHLFTAESRVTVEVWDSRGAGTGNKIFLGGISLTMAQLLANGDSHKKVRLPLVGGSESGTVMVRITWTPK